MWYTICSRSAKAGSCTTTIRGIATVSVARTVSACSAESDSRPSKIDRTASTATGNCSPKSATPVLNLLQVSGNRFIQVGRLKGQNGATENCWKVAQNCRSGKCRKVHIRPVPDMHQ